VRIVLDLDRLPLVRGATASDAASSGEEYELIVTAPASLDRAAFQREFGVPITAIGSVEAPDAGGPGVETRKGAQRVPLPRGHSHFSG
jgi:thiamine monophosphate kinase